jgi:uncharacterized membrane protein YdbT with pleckstrin-like domain
MSKLHYRESPTPKQKKAFSSYLAEDEELILVTGLSPAYLRQQAIIYFAFPGIILGAIVFGMGWIFPIDKLTALGLAIVAMCLVSAFKTSHLHHSNRYLLTTRRVIVKKGVFNVKLTAALYDKITHIEMDQGFFDRIALHHGTIIVNTAGMNKEGIVLKFVDYPIELKNLLERLINREREQYGGRISSVTSVEGEIID